MTLQELRARPHWSFSSLNSLLNICSLQWYFQKVAKLKPTHTSVNLVAGCVYHRTLDQVFLARKVEMPMTLEEALELYTEDWRRSSKEEPIKFGKLDADGIEEQGRGLIEVAWNNIDDTEKVLQVSEVFCVPLIYDGRFLSKPLVGEFDLVVEKDGQPLVIDWKTSATRWAKTKADKSLQATAYSLAYWQKHGVNPSVRFDISVKNKTPVFESHVTSRNEDDWKLLGMLAAKAETIVEKELFYPSRDSFACSDCGFKGACEEYCRGVLPAKAA
ncbi:PD-(D/E)XK nuclease family protein [Pontiellaceae bacterium B12227]|nr:PD-(D/E)XK nuclease family protein [Pontiellaceae bacterium B12227]